MHVDLTYDQKAIVSRSSNGFELLFSFKPINCANSNFAGDPRIGRKSVIGYCFFMAGALVCKSSKKQYSVSTSTTKAKYITLDHFSRKVVGDTPIFQQHSSG